MRIGIDLGTTFSAMAFVNDSGNAQLIPNREGDRTTPSVVLFEDGVPTIGREAKANSITDPYNVSEFVKRQMGNRDWSFESESGDKFSSEDISAIVLKKLKTDAQDFLDKPVTEAVITVPAYFSDAQRKATQDAGRIAGLNVIAIINEPTAAALFYGVANDSFSGNILVYDLGGGTFDVTILNVTPRSMNVIATHGDRYLGGFDIDNRLITYAVAEFKKQTGMDISEDALTMQGLREKVESAKRALSVRPKASIPLLYKDRAIKLEITREQFEKMIADLIERTQDSLEITLNESKLEWHDIKKILLVGGSTRIPAIGEMITKVTGIVPSRDINPDEAVAMGAAHYAAALKSGSMMDEQIEVGRRILSDVNSHSLGIIAVDGDSGKEFNSIILRRNTPLPAKASEEYYTASDNQEILDLSITEGEVTDDLDYVNVIGRSYIRLGYRPKDSPLNVVISYDLNGIIHAKVMDGIDNRDLGEMRIQRKANLTDEELHLKVTRMSDINIV